VWSLCLSSAVPSVEKNSIRMFCGLGGGELHAVDLNMISDQKCEIMDQNSAKKHSDDVHFLKSDSRTGGEQLLSASADNTVLIWSASGFLSGSTKPVLTCLQRLKPQDQLPRCGDLKSSLVLMGGQLFCGLGGGKHVVAYERTTAGALWRFAKSWSDIHTSCEDGDNNPLVTDGSCLISGATCGSATTALGDGRMVSGSSAEDKSQGQVKVLAMGAQRCLACIQMSIGVEALQICGKRLVAGGSNPNGSGVFLYIFAPPPAEEEKGGAGSPDFELSEDEFSDEDGGAGGGKRRASFAASPARSPVKRRATTVRDIVGHG